MRHFPGALAIPAVVASVLAAAEASAQGPPPVPPANGDQALGAAVDVVPGASCLDQETLDAEVQTWLGRDHVRSDVHVHVKGDDHDPRSVSFLIVREGHRRDRGFDNLPPDCADATAVVGLAIALAIDATVVPGLAAAPEPATTDSVRPERVAAVQASAGLDVLAGASVGAAAGVEYGLAEWLSARVDLLGQFSWGNTIDGVSGTFDVVVAAALPQVCAGGAVTDRFRLELCSGAGIGVIHVQGSGYVVSKASTGSWVVATGGLRLLFRAGIPWAMDIDGVFPVHVPAFRAENGAGADLYRAPNPAGALLSIGPAFTF